jgi:hypothetical protein
VGAAPAELPGVVFLLAGGQSRLADDFHFIPGYSEAAFFEVDSYEYLYNSLVGVEATAPALPTRAAAQHRPSQSWSNRNDGRLVQYVSQPGAGAWTIPFSGLF